MKQISQMQWMLNGALLALAAAGLLVAGAVLGGVPGFLLVLAVLLAVVALAGLYFTNYVIQRPKDHPMHDAGTSRQRARRHMARIERHQREQHFIGELEPYGLEEWYTESGDGLRLHAVFVPGAPGEKRAAILLHGHRQSASQMAEYAVYFRGKLGLNVLMPDARAHGKSEGKYIGMGWPDRLDCLNWMDKVVAALGENTQIMLYGISMGAATAMMAAGEAVPPQLRFIAEDCGYTSVQDEVLYQLKNGFQLPPFPILPLGRFLIKRMAKYDIREASALDQMMKTPLPALFIHGDADDYVPYAMARPLYEAAATEDKELITIPGAGHVQAFAQDEAGLIKDAVERYISRFMPAKPPEEGSSRTP